MSATKDGTQRGLSRNKGQVLAWDDGRGWAGQMFTWNGSSGHPQAMGAAGAWHGAPLPTPTGYCKDSDHPRWAQSQKHPEGAANLGSGMVIPSQSLPTAGERKSRQGGFSLCHSGITCFSGLRWGHHEWLGRLCTTEGHLTTEASGPEILAAGQGAASAQRVLFL